MKYLQDLYVFQLLGVLAALSLASEVAVRRGAADTALLRLAWNWFLLVSFAACVLTGFGLFVPMEKETSRLVFRLHLWTGAACAWAGIYHSALRMRRMLPLTVRRGASRSPGDGRGGSVA